MYGRVRMYNLGFAIFTVVSIFLAVTWMHGSAGALWLIVWRVVQGVGGAMLIANSTAILTDAFPANQRGLALGINSIAAIAGLVHRPDPRRRARARSTGAWSSSSRCRSACSARSGPTSSCATSACASPRRSTGGATSPSPSGLIAVLVGITYGIQPYGGHTDGLDQPAACSARSSAASRCWSSSCVIETKVAEPMFHLVAVPHPGVHRRQPRQPACWRSAAAACSSS